MDPKQTVIDIEAAIVDEDFELAAELIGYYWQWRQKGGFEPTSDSGKGGDAAVKYYEQQLN